VDSRSESFTFLVFLRSGVVRPHRCHCLGPQFEFYTRKQFEANSRCGAELRRGIRFVPPDDIFAGFLRVARISGAARFSRFPLGIALPAQVPPEAIRPARFLGFIPARESRCGIRFSRLSFSSTPAVSLCLVLRFTDSFAQRAPELHFPARSSSCRPRILGLPASFPLERLSARIFVTASFFAAESFSFPMTRIHFASTVGVLRARRAAALRLGVKTSFLWLLNLCITVFDEIRMRW
jgi:hypothetical protein